MTAAPSASWTEASDDLVEIVSVLGVAYYEDDDELHLEATEMLDEYLAAARLPTVLAEPLYWETEADADLISLAVDHEVSELISSGTICAQRLSFCFECRAEICAANREDRSHLIKTWDEGVLPTCTKCGGRLRTMNYSAYLATQYWAQRREAILERDLARCVLCNSGNRLNVHHRTYIRRGCELPTDLFSVCADCHSMFHKHRSLAGR